MDQMNEIVTVLLCTITGMAIAAVLIWIGYWMGRNSRELPVRSYQNPRRVLKGPSKPPIPEPEGDLFKDAMTEPYDPSKKEPGIPTIRR